MMIFIPPDEERCCRNNGSRWRCKNFRMTKSVDGPITTYCQKHYYTHKKNYQFYLQRKKLKKIDPDPDDDDEDESDGFDSDIETWDSSCSKQRKRGDDNSTRRIQPPTTTTNHTSSDRIVEGDDYNSDQETRFSNRIKLRKLSEVYDRAAIQPPATNHPIDTNSGTIIEEAEEPMVEVESFEHYKSKCFELSVELERKKVELEKKNVECTELQGKLEEVERTKTADATEKPNAETSSGFKTEEEVLNVNDRGCLEERPSQFGSPSQAHLEMSNKVFVNLVSDSDDDGDGLGESGESYAPVDSNTSFGDPGDMLAMKKCYRNNGEMTWKSEADMLSSFKEDPVFCMKAVCALYRQKISEDEIPPKGLVIDSDTSRCIDLAKFLMDGDCKGDLKKSVKELETLDPTAVDDCRKLAVRYSVFIFDIFESRKDPFFFPATTAAMEM